MLIFTSREAERHHGQQVLRDKQQNGCKPSSCCALCSRGTPQNISAATGLPYRDMLFFDDDESNVRTVANLGACCFKVNKDSGLTFAAVKSGFKKYREVCLSRSSMKTWLQRRPPKVDQKDA